jgi:hypothetical protein
MYRSFCSFQKDVPVSILCVIAREEKPCSFQKTSNFERSCSRSPNAAAGVIALTIFLHCSLNMIPFKPKATPTKKSAAEFALQNAQHEAFRLTMRAVSAERKAQHAEANARFNVADQVAMDEHEWQLQKRDRDRRQDMLDADNNTQLAMDMFADGKNVYEIEDSDVKEASKVKEVSGTKHSLTDDDEIEDDEVEIEDSDVKKASKVKEASRTKRSLTDVDEIEDDDDAVVIVEGSTVPANDPASAFVTPPRKQIGTPSGGGGAAPQEVVCPQQPRLTDFPAPGFVSPGRRHEDDASASRAAVAMAPEVTTTTTPERMPWHPLRTTPEGLAGVHAAAVAATARAAHFAKTAAAAAAAAVIDPPNAAPAGAAAEADADAPEEAPPLSAGSTLVEGGFLVTVERVPENHPHVVMLTKKLRCIGEYPKDICQLRTGFIPLGMRNEEDELGEESIVTGHARCCRVLYLLTLSFNFSLTIVAPVEDFGMQNLVDRTLESLSEEVRRWNAPVLGELGISVIEGAQSLMVDETHASERPVNLLFCAKPMVDGKASSRNCKGMPEFHPQDYQYNLNYWTRQLQYRNRKNGVAGRLAFVELAALIIEALLLPVDRADHQAAVVRYNENNNGPFVGQYLAMTLFDQYAECFKIFMQMPVCQMARRLGWNPVFALRSGLCNSRGVLNERLSFRVCSKNKNGSSFLSLIGFWRQPTGDKSEYFLLGISNRGYPLTTRDLQMSLET